MGALKMRLGQAEVRDQIAAARHAVARYGFVDPRRVAVSGVSYGGYVVGMALSDRYGMQHNVLKTMSAEFSITTICQAGCVSLI